MLSLPLSPRSERATLMVVTLNVTTKMKPVACTLSVTSSLTLWLPTSEVVTRLEVKTSSTPSPFVRCRVELFSATNNTVAVCVRDRRLVLLGSLNLELPR